MAPEQRRSRKRPSRAQQRRQRPQTTPAPPDYRGDYAFVRRDLYRITILSTILLVGLVGAYFVF